MEETFKRYELLCKDVKHQIDFVDDYYEFDFKHLEETLNEMKKLQKQIQQNQWVESSELPTHGRADGLGFMGQSFF